MEQIMLDIMYEVPSKNNIEECVISEEVVMHKEKPIIVYQREAESA
jgi:ATP-dependent Clp protease ATP-binding subunit ClpX